jgi:hypothetical protein
MLIFNKYFYTVTNQIKVVLWRPCPYPKRLHLPNRGSKYITKLVKILCTSLFELK